MPRTMVEGVIFDLTIPTLKLKREDIGIGVHRNLERVLGDPWRRS